MLMSLEQRKKSVRSSGFSPSLPYAAWKNQIEASMPMRKPRRPPAFASNPWVTDRCVNDCVCPAGRST